MVLMVSTVLDKNSMGSREAGMTGAAAWVRHSMGIPLKIKPALGRCDAAETTSAECQP